VRQTFNVGDRIEVLALEKSPLPIRGNILELDDANPGDYGYAKIRLTDSPALSVPDIWVYLRSARLL
jgi:hypothetical protein